MSYNSFSVSVSNPPAHESLREALAEAQDEYLAAGGTITVVAGHSGKPHISFNNRCDLSLES